MPIAALPPSTAQAIGSTSILPDACAVVKELIDNGLDAGATSISVEISPNTLDLIQVKDNGHGIAPEDFENLCKRAYTSKIQTLDDLRNVGGQSLGFRGVALASAADMVDTLTVITRSKNEIVASVLKYDAEGRLVNTEKASHAVGTSVCLTGFLRKIPVRRQTAVKSASKTIAKIKKLIQAYAMARPGTRLSLKVLNSKNGKDNWTYAPSSTASIVDASRKVVGVEITGQCVNKTWPENPGSNASVKLLAYFLKADADFSKVGNVNQYISVDGRPLSADRGTAKEIIKLYKSYVRSAAKVNGTSTLNDPFLNLHITCPPGAYDVNVEPAKDDVLFAEREELIQTVEELFKATYGEPQKASENSEKQVTSVNEFNVLLRQPATQEPASPPSTNRPPALATQSRTTLDLTKTAQVDSPSTEDDDPSQAESREAASDDGLNPWSIAKTHFFHRSPKSNKASQFVTPTKPSFRSSGGRNATATQSSPSETLSPCSQSSPEDGNVPPRRSTTLPARGVRSSNGYTKASRERDRERYGNGSLDTWFVKNSGSTFPNSSAGDILDDEYETESVMLEDLNDDIVEDPSRIINKPFKPPLSKKPQDRRQRQLVLSPDTEPSNAQSEKRQEFPVMEEWSARLHQNLPDDQSIFSSQDTERALDFERRKKEANIAHRKQLQRQYLASPASSQPASKSPHKNRYLAARATLSEYSPQSQSGPPQKVQAASNSDLTMKENDPRTYLMRHQAKSQNSEANDLTKKLKRIPTSCLPLEIIPKEFDVHNLGVKLDMSLLHLTKQCKYMAEVDYYVSSGNGNTIYSPFDSLIEPDLPEICKDWEATIVKLVKDKYRPSEVDLYDAACGSDEAFIEKVDIYDAIKLKSSS